MKSTSNALMDDTARGVSTVGRDEPGLVMQFGAAWARVEGRTDLVYHIFV
jgi:hypothetical protein